VFPGLIRRGRAPVPLFLTGSITIPGPDRSRQQCYRISEAFSPIPPVTHSGNIGSIFEYPVFFIHEHGGDAGQSPGMVQVFGDLDGVAGRPH